MNYSNGKIYKILNTITNDIYVGSCCVNIEDRLKKHKSMRNVKNYLLYKKMRELGKDVFYIKLIQEAPSESKAELRALEGKYIRELGTLNQRIAGRNGVDYRKDTKEQKREYDKQYRIKHEARIKEKHICQICGGSYQIKSRLLHEKSKIHQQALQNINKENEYYNIN